MAKYAKIITFQFTISTQDDTIAEITGHHLITCTNSLNNYARTLDPILCYAEKYKLIFRGEHHVTNQVRDTILYVIKYGEKGTTGELDKGSPANIPIDLDDYTLKDMAMGVYLPRGRDIGYISFCFLTSDNTPNKSMCIKIFKNIFETNTPFKVKKSNMTSFFLTKEINNYNVRSFSVINGNVASESGLVVKKKTVTFNIASTNGRNFIERIGDFLRSKQLRESGTILKISYDSPGNEHAKPMEIEINDNFEENLAQLMIRPTLLIDDQEDKDMTMLVALNSHFQNILNENAQ